MDRTEIQASTQVFAIPELFTIVCDYVFASNSAKSTLRSLARVNRLCSEIALDALWRELDNFKPFLALKVLYCDIPSREIQGGSHKVEMKLLDAENGTKAYMRYLERVKVLAGVNNSHRIHEYTGPYFNSVWSLDAMFEHIPVAHLQKVHVTLGKREGFSLFPHLIEIRLHQDFQSSCFLAMSTILGRNLQTLYLQEDVEKSGTDVLEAFISGIPLLYPQLTTLGLIAKQTSLQAGWLTPFLPQLSGLTGLQLAIDYTELHDLLKGHMLNNLTTLAIIPVRAYDLEELNGLLQDLTALLKEGSLPYLRSISLLEDESEQAQDESSGHLFSTFESFLIAFTSPNRNLQALPLKLELYTDVAWNFSNDELCHIGSILARSQRTHYMETLLLSPYPVERNVTPRTWRSTMEGVYGLVSQCPNLTTCGLFIDDYDEEVSVDHGVISNTDTVGIVSDRLRNLTIGSLRDARDEHRKQIRERFPNLDRLELIQC